MSLSGKMIVVGVTGGIAAYKSADICSRLVKSGASVEVVMTESATHFVTPTTFRAITGQRVITGLWDEPRDYEVTHVSLSDKADAFLIAPATANIIGKIANGIADDMLSTTIMAAACPIIIAPAMNTKMWQNRIVQQNVDKLKSLGYEFIGPESGRLACGTIGFGRMSEPAKIIRFLEDFLSREKDLEGVKIIITAGPTIEPIDPVRFIMNRSSGKMGYSIAEAAVRRGADVCLISGPTSISPPPGIEFVQVKTTNEMLDAVMQRFASCDVLIGAAAPVDFTPVEQATEKIKKSGNGKLTLELMQTPDIIATAGKHKTSQILVAFAAETEDLIHNAQEKLAVKNADMIIANDVSRNDIGFSSDYNEVFIIDKYGTIEKLSRMPKIDLANKILDKVRQKLSNAGK